MRLSTAFEWLDWIGKLHPSTIDLGLDRVKEVAARLDLLTPHCPVVIVGGTNGKGSTVAGLESIYRAAGYKTGAFTSPYLISYNEQIRIAGKEVTDEMLCQAFEKVEGARGSTSLTPFEFGTLAALVIFKQEQLDVWILEVGLGGRLDAVNILDADVAIVTSISLDHMDYLGDTREKIAFEKAGIFRKNKFAIYGDREPPVTLMDFAKQQEAKLFCLGKDFDYEEDNTTWSFLNSDGGEVDLPKNNLSLQNMAIVLMTVTLLKNKFPLTRKAIETGLTEIPLKGRLQFVKKTATEIYDVAHNPASVTLLAEKLKTLQSKGKVRAVFSMLADKDIETSINIISSQIDYWYVAPIKDKRAASNEKLKGIFEKLAIENVFYFEDLAKAYNNASIQAAANDIIVVFGSFHTLRESGCYEL